MVLKCSWGINLQLLKEVLLYNYNAEVKELLGWGTSQGFIHGTRSEGAVRVGGPLRGLYMAPEVRELLGWGDNIILMLRDNTKLHVCLECTTCLLGW